MANVSSFDWWSFVIAPSSVLPLVSACSAAFSSPMDWNRSFCRISMPFFSTASWRMEMGMFSSDGQRISSPISLS